MAQRVVEQVLDDAGRAPWRRWAGGALKLNGEVEVDFDVATTPDG